MEDRPTRTSLLSQLARYWPHLPPLLRALTCLALLAALASLGVATWTFLPLHTHQEALANRGLGLAPAFGGLALACMWPVTVYTQRFRYPPREGGPAPISTRMLSILTLVLVAPPFAALVCATLVSPSASWFGVVFFFEMFSGYLLLAVYIWAIVRVARPIR